MIDRPQSESPTLTRRELLSNVSSGASGLALTSILFKDGYAVSYTHLTLPTILLV